MRMKNVLFVTISCSWMQFSVDVMLKSQSGFTSQPVFSNLENPNPNFMDFSGVAVD